MKRKIPLLLLMFVLLSCKPGQSDKNQSATQSPEQGIETLALSRFRPHPVYNIPVTHIEKAAFPVTDMHSHDYAETREEIDRWVETMEQCGIEKTVILSTETGAGFDEVVKKYASYPERFELWCGLDYTGYDTDPQWTGHAIKELERCHALGAKGVGELGDKGLGLFYSKPTAAWGLHMDNPALKPIWEKCAELKMPVNIHVADPIWMYLAMDSTNDGLMNAWKWAVDLSKEGILDHGQLMETLDRVAGQNPGTTFVACHFANCSHDLDILAGMLDRHPNLWADISARYAETAPIPRHVRSFYEKYRDRLLYGTDMGPDREMYRITFRILESEDEHFYEIDQFGYHWPLNGLGLSGEVLEKVYNRNASALYHSL
ncbi:MAG: amidohydrolase family protein [Bacteroidota bacterium]